MRFTMFTKHIIIVLLSCNVHIRIFHRRKLKRILCLHRVRGHAFYDNMIRCCCTSGRYSAAVYYSGCFVRRKNKTRLDRINRPTYYKKKNFNLHHSTQHYYSVYSVYYAYYTDNACIILYVFILHLYTVNRI